MPIPALFYQLQGQMGTVPADTKSEKTKVSAPARPSTNGGFFFADPPA